jgi:hypothetical protein
MLHASRTLMASLVVAMAALAGCGGGGGDGDGSGGGGSGLVGVWRADIGGIIRENPTLLASIRGTCSGPVVLTFNANGTFSQSLAGSCTFAGGARGTVSVNGSGNYGVEGSQIRVTNAVNSGTIVAGGVTQSFSLVTNGLANFTLSGNTLVLEPAVERGTKQTYTRG